MSERRQLLFAVAFLFGLLTLVGLLGGFSSIADPVLNWAGFLAAVALVLGVGNLLAVHGRRLLRDRNLYSGILVISMLVVFALAITDSEALGLTEGGVDTVFSSVQAPLEAALASLLAFFLLFAGFQMIRRQRSWWTVLFLLTVIALLVGNALVSSSMIPEQAASWMGQIRNTIDTVFVTSGMRGILIGVALGTIIVSIRLIIGLDRPYNR